MPPKISIEKCKRIVQLKYDHGLTVRQIVERLGVSERSVFYILKSARIAGAAAANRVAAAPPTTPAADAGGQ